MDPGKLHLDHLKQVPNLIEEDPAAITPAQQKVYMDMPWKDFSAMLQKNKHDAEEAFQKRHSQHLLNGEQSLSSTASSSPAVQTPKETSSSSSVSSSSSSFSHPAVSGQVSESETGGWDSETGYQDKQHVSRRH